MLLVESGSRELTENLLPLMRRVHGPQVAIDLVTCYTGLPAGFGPDTRVFRVTDYTGRAGRKRLYAALRGLNHPVVGILCSAEPIMTKWKWVLAARLPAKVFIVNENLDYFWLDYSQWRIVVRFALERSGLSGPGAVRTLARLALFPFTLAWLLAYAGFAHARRLLR